MTVELREVTPGNIDKCIKLRLAETPKRIGRVRRFVDCPGQSISNGEINAVRKTGEDDCAPVAFGNHEPAANN